LALGHGILLLQLQLHGPLLELLLLELLGSQRLLALLHPVRGAGDYAGSL